MDPISSSSSEEAVKPPVLFFQDENRKTVDDLISTYEAKIEAKMKKLMEQQNENILGLKTLSEMYPEIPVIHDDTVKVRFTKTHYRFNTSFHIDGKSENTFFIYEIEGTTRYEMIFDEERRNVINVREIMPRVGELAMYAGKHVLVAPEGGEYHEDETTITLAPPQQELNDYEHNLYRGTDDIVVNEEMAYDPDLYNETQYVIHFGSTPWLMKSLAIGKHSNVIFRNLHDDKDVRRYILDRCDDNQFFMLGDEIYYVRDSKHVYSTYREIKIVQCRSRRIVFNSYERHTAVVTCRNYAVSKSGKNEITVWRVARLEEGE